MPLFDPIFRYYLYGFMVWDFDAKFLCDRQIWDELANPYPLTVPRTVQSLGAWGKIREEEANTGFMSRKIRFSRFVAQEKTTRSSYKKTKLLFSLCCPRENDAKLLQKDQVVVLSRREEKTCQPFQETAAGDNINAQIFTQD